MNRYQSNSATVNKRLRYYTIGTKAFWDGNYEIEPGRKPLEEVQNRLKKWDAMCQKKITIRSPLTFVQLKYATTSKMEVRNHTLYNEGKDVIKILSTGNDPMEIVDRDSKVLGFRFTLPPKTFDLLKESDCLLPKRECANAGRGNFAHRHYAVWCCFMKEPKLSLDYRKEKESADKWFEKVKPVFQYVSDIIRLLNPEMYAKMTRFDKASTVTGFPKALAGVWHGVAINQRMRKEGGDKHLDWNDCKTIYNCIIPYGDFSGGNLYLPTLNMEIELKAGEAFFFYGRLIEHQVLPVIGERNVLDLFCHEGNFTKVEKVLKNGKGFGERKGKSMDKMKITKKREAKRISKEKKDRKKR